MTGFTVGDPLNCVTVTSPRDLLLTGSTDEVKAKYSYQIKLRDTGSYGFLVPKDNILPSGQEMLSALKYFGDYLLGNNGMESFPAGKADEFEVEWKDLKKRRR